MTKSVIDRVREERGSRRFAYLRIAARFDAGASRDAEGACRADESEDGGWVFW